MNMTNLLDVAIGVSLVYLGASLFVTIINEYIGQLLKLRAKQLAKDLKTLIDSPDALEVLSNNPALKPFFAEDGAAGSYVDTKMMAEQLIGGLQKAAKAQAGMDEIVQSIQTMNDCRLKTQLLALTQVASSNVDKFVKSTSAWIDQSLTMMGEIYKKRMQVLSFGIGLAMAVALNLDTVGLATHLYSDADAREAVAGIASGLVNDVSREEFERCSGLPPQELRTDAGCAGLVNLVEGLRQRNDTFGDLPIGWPARAANAHGWPFAWTAVPGWILTALAISLGASFWFDLLSRLVNVRHGMRKPLAAVDS